MKHTYTNKSAGGYKCPGCHSCIRPDRAAFRKHLMDSGACATAALEKAFDANVDIAFLFHRVP